MRHSNRMFQTLIFILLAALSVMTSCGGGGGGGGGSMPGAPAGLTATVSKVDPTHGTITLHWNAAANASSYRVRYEYTSGLTKTTGILYGSIIAGTSFTTPAYPVNTTFYYIVTGVNSVGREGPASAEISVRLGAPAPPSTVMAVASYNTATPRVTVSWTSVNEAASYNLYRDTSSSVTTTLVTGVSATATSYIDTAVANDSTYYYVLKGVNSFGPGTASMVTAATPTSGPLATVTVSGKATYEDKEYNRNVGFTGQTTFKAVRFANVELVNAAGTTIQAGRTSSDGSYSFSIAPSNIGNSMYVRVISSATPTGSQQMNVKDWSTNLFAVKTGNFTLSGNTSIDLSIPVTSLADGAFNILDVMTSGFQFLNVYAASALNLNSLSLNAFWENNVSNGTYYCPIGTSPDPTYCPGGAGISVFSDPFGSQDTDEFDDDVLLHEFGHFTAENFSLDDSMGGQHYLDANNLDMRLTWSEGWGDYFQGAVKFWLYGTDPSLISSAPGVPLSQYVDTVNGQAYLIVDVGDADDIAGGSPYCHNLAKTAYYCTYSTNEISVANVLWNHMAGTGNYGMQFVWNIIAGFNTSPPVTDPVNLELFWDRWKNVYGSPLATIYTDRLIDYSNDTYEYDNTPAPADAKTITLGVPQNRKLYSATAWPDADIDYVKFGVTAGLTYTITTSNLHNGADTYLTLYSAGGTTVIAASPSTRDNTDGTTWVQFSNYDLYDAYGNWVAAPLNTTTKLASKMTFVSTETASYYVAVTSSPNRPKSSGKYGSYTLSVTSP